MATRQRLAQVVVLTLAAVLAFTAYLPWAAAQDKSWVGELILPTKRSKDIPLVDGSGGKEVQYRYSGRWPIKVREERDGQLRIHDGNREGWVAKGDFVLEKDAPTYFDRRIQTNPDDAFAWDMHGASWNEKGEYDKAIKDYNEAIRLDPSYAVAFNNRGVAWKNKKEYDTAIRDYDEAIRLDQKYALAFSNRGVAWQLKNELDRAIADYDEAIRINPKFTWPRYHRGDARMLKKDYDRALADFDEAIRLDPKYAVAIYGKACCLALKGDPDAALESLEHALKAGYRNFKLMTKDQRLDSIRSNPRYEGLLKRYSK